MTKFTLLNTISKERWIIWVVLLEWTVFINSSLWFSRLCETHNALQLRMFFFFSFFRQLYPEYRGIRSKTLFYRPSNRYRIKKEDFQVYSFSEQAAAKGNCRLLKYACHFSGNRTTRKRKTGLMGLPLS